MDTHAKKSTEAQARSGDGTESLETTKPRKLVGAHYEILSQMASNSGNPLRKLPGGFWVVDPDPDEYEEGEWYGSTSAVTALVRHGLVSYRRGRTDAVELTPVGIEALRTGVYPPLAKVQP